MIIPRLVLVKVHVTSSPASRLKVAVRVPVLPVLFASEQLSAVRSQPLLASSNHAYVPGVKFVRLNVPLLVAIEPVSLLGPVKPNVSVPPTITFFTVSDARLVLVKVHVTLSPASRLKVAVRVPVLPVLFASE